ncbi:MAG: peroxiredoxin [Wenzhouxiangella sp.]|nr:MAG: peroxiredoxin [Wenzhouxiangella sp.]
MTIAAGDAIPSAQLTIMTENGPTPVDSRELLGKGRTVLFAVPGPFTPTCSAEHLPGFIDHYSALVERGVERIVCMAVSDIFVMDAWAKASGVTDQIVMAADGNGDFTAALGLALDARAFGMGSRSQRFALIVEDGIVVETLIEPAGEFRVSSADYVLERLA